MRPPLIGGFFDIVKFAAVRARAGARTTRLLAQHLSGCISLGSQSASPAERLAMPLSALVVTDSAEL